MPSYRCPLCGRTLERNLVLYLGHTDQHVIDKIKEEHPEWVEANGVCKPCAEYYKRQLRGGSGETNIGPQGQRRRFVMGVLMLALSLFLALVFISTGLGRPWRLLLFLPVFLGMLGLIQAREKTCVVWAELGRGSKILGRSILVKSALAAAGLTLFFFLLP